MKDSMANNIMAKYGVAGVMPQLQTTEKRKTILPIPDGGIKKSKEEQHAALYPTKQNKATLVLEHFMKTRLVQPTLDEREVEHNIFEECYAFLEYGITSGAFTKEEISAVTSFTDARVQQENAKQGLEWYETAASLLLDYRGAMYNAQKKITDWVEYAKVVLEEAGSRADLNLKGNKWIIDEVIKKDLVPQAEVDEIATLQAVKDNVIAMYTAKANMFTIGDSPLGSAAVYAALYIENLNNEIKRENLDIKKQYDAKLSTFRASVQKEEGEARDPNADEKAILMESIVPYKHRGFSSISSLFPVGNKEFLSWARDGEFRSYKSLPVRASAYFVHEGGFTPEQIEEIKQMKGKEVIFDEGALVGTPYSISAEDRFDMNAKDAYPTKKDIKAQGCTLEYEEALYRQPFLRGPKVWHGGVQKGRVLFVSIYKSSFKLWLGNFQNI